MSQVVVDTDVASYIFNWHSSVQRYVNALRGAIAAGWGVRRRDLLEQFIGGFGVVYADDALCTSWAVLRAGARAAGRSLSPQDASIAATALGLDAPLATNNRRDFEHVQQLRLLSPEPA
jgi:tRNA(fMet)-specific endonuclease VapC